jgi:gamma-glutamyltranspeptidase / glutathione hydrolase
MLPVCLCVSPSASASASTSSLKKKFNLLTPFLLNNILPTQQGNAIDAAAAVQFALNVVQPQSTGIGGGLFGIVYMHDGKVHSIDGREEAPAAFQPDNFCADPPTCTHALDFMETATGGNPVGVPGTLAAIQRLLADHGTMNLAQVMQPAIQLARNGFPMYQHLYDRIVDNTWRLIRWPASAELFLNAQHRPKAEIGQIWSNPKLADTFERLSNNWRDLYEGDIANDIIDAVHKARNPVTNLTGLMELTDLKRYRAVYRKPLRYTYRDAFDVIGMAPPSGGGLALALILHQLEMYDMPNSFKPLSTEWAAKFIDASDASYADRNRYIGDADFVDVPINGMLNKTYAADRVRSLFRYLAAGPNISAGNPWLYESTPSPVPEIATAPLNPRHGTTHMSIADIHGNVVSLTTTIEENLGSAVAVRGFLLNNELTDFTALPRDPQTGLPYQNAPQGGTKERRTALPPDNTSLGGKRPMSSMTPTVIVPLKKPATITAVGAPGGSKIPLEVANFVLNFLDFDMDISEATNAPRIISRNNFAWFEKEFNVERPDVIRRLRARQYDLQVLNTSRPLGFLQSVQVVPEGGGTFLFRGKADNLRLPAASAEGV